MKIRIILTLILMLTGSAAFAQTRIYQWDNGFCSYQSTYDAKKYTVEQLTDTGKLLTLNFFPNAIDPTPTKLADIKQLRVETLDAEYQQRTDDLKRLKIIKTTYWEALRQRHLRELREVYELSRASLLGYANPARLKDVKFAGACVEKYAAPLEKGGGELLAAWLAVNQDSRKKNGSPERIENIYNEQFNSPERMQYAQNEVMRFGWWNCVNALIDREPDYPQIEREYKKLFVKTKQLECEEP